MAAHPAVGVHDDLASRHPRVAVGPADHKPAGGVDQVTGLVVQVPLFVNEGDVLKIDTRTGKYVTRV